MKRTSKSYHRHSKLMSKYNAGLKTLLQGLSEPVFYGVFVYKVRKNDSKTDFQYNLKTDSRKLQNDWLHHRYSGGNGMQPNID